MKKVVKLCLLFICLLFLISCGKKEEDEPTKSVDFLGQNYVFDHYDSYTGTHTYQATSGDQLLIKETSTGAGKRLEITNGNQSYRLESTGIDTYVIHFTDGTYFSSYPTGGHGSTTDDTFFFNMDSFDDVNNLFYEPVEEDEEDHSSKAGVIVLSIFMIIGGFLNYKAPYAIFELNHLFRGWQYKSLEPSEAYITYTKVVGAIVGIIGVLILLFNIF